MPDSTITLDLQSWDRFVPAYWELVQSALRSISFVPRGCVDDWTQSFFLVQMEAGFLERMPVIQGRFRSYLFRCIYNHAVNESRRGGRQPKLTDLEDGGGIDSFPAPPAVEPGLDDEAGPLFALSVLHLAIQKVRAHWAMKGKPEVWTIFEELVLAPLDPDRTPLTRDDLMKRFPCRNRQYLDNCVTSVKRVFQRVLPAIIPSGLSDRLTPQERFQEWSELLSNSPTLHRHRVRLAVLRDPSPDADGPMDGSIAFDLERFLSGEDPDLQPEFVHDELRVLSSFCITRPLDDYVPGPWTGRRRAPFDPASPVSVPKPDAHRLDLLAVINQSNQAFEALPIDLKLALLIELKSHAKRVHRIVRQDDDAEPARRTAAQDHTMPAEIAHLVYNLACALALLRCDKRIDGIGTDRLRKNLLWLVAQSWLDSRVRAILVEASAQLRCERVHPIR